METDRKILLTDREYPRRLLEIPQAPKQLYVRGKLPEEGVPSVAVIGARDCSYYGQEVAKRLGRLFGENGIQVISGMARGIDGIGQQAALQAGGSSFAVLGCGADICYPRQNQDLYDRLCKQGGVISEYEWGTPPRAGYFPPRNRIVSGLADAVIVVEARKKSGTLITVDMALEQGKEVYAVPGRLVDDLSSGCNYLIKNGAGILLDMEEFMEELWKQYRLKRGGMLQAGGRWTESGQTEEKQTEDERMEGKKTEGKNSEEKRTEDKQGEDKNGKEKRTEDKQKEDKKGEDKNGKEKRTEDKQREDKNRKEKRTEDKQREDKNRKEKRTEDKQIGKQKAEKKPEGVEQIDSLRIKRVRELSRGMGVETGKKAEMYEEIYMALEENPLSVEEIEQRLVWQQKQRRREKNEQERAENQKCTGKLKNTENQDDTENQKSRESREERIMTGCLMRLCMDGFAVQVSPGYFARRVRD